MTTTTSMNVDWCYEGGCTYMADEYIAAGETPETTELEQMYSEPCEAMYD